MHILYIYIHGFHTGFRSQTHARTCFKHDCSVCLPNVPGIVYAAPFFCWKVCYCLTFNIHFALHKLETLIRIYLYDKINDVNSSNFS